MSTTPPKKFPYVIPTNPGYLLAGGYVPNEGPVIDYISPTHGPDIGGNTVSIFGARFTGATRVRFANSLGVGGTDPFVVISDTEIHAQPSADLLDELVKVFVVTPKGTATMNAAYKYDASGSAPVLSSLNHDQGDPLGNGESIILTGSGFTSASAVNFGASTASFVVNSDTQITATLPAHAAGSVNVSVTGPGGTSGTLPFEYWSPLQLSPRLFCRGPNYSDNAGAGPGVFTDEGSLADNPTQAGAAASPTQATTTDHPPVPHFDGSNDILSTVSTWHAAITGNDLFVGTLFFAGSVGADASTYDGNLVTDAGNAEVGLGIGTSGLAATVITNGPGYTYNRSGPVTCGAGAWHLGMLMVDHADTGIEGKVGVDGGGWGATFACPGGYTYAAPGAISLGHGYDATAGYFDGYMAMAIVINGTVSAGNIVKLRKWCNQYFGTAV